MKTPTLDDQNQINISTKQARNPFQAQHAMRRHPSIVMIHTRWSILEMDLITVYKREIWKLQS